MFESLSTIQSMDKSATVGEQRGDGTADVQGPAYRGIRWDQPLTLGENAMRETVLHGVSKVDGDRLDSCRCCLPLRFGSLPSGFLNGVCHLADDVEHKGGIRQHGDVAA